MRWIRQPWRQVRLEWDRLGRPLQEVLAGFAVGLGTILGLTVALFSLAGSLIDLGHPSTGLFRTLAEVGVALLIAYSVAVASAERQLRTSDEHEFWVGFTAGVGFAALIGLGLSLGLAEYRAAGHAGTLDLAGFCWIASSLGILGMLVAAQPIAAYSWRRASERDSRG